MNNDEKEKRLNTDASLSAQPTKEDTGNSTDSNTNNDDNTKDDQQDGKSLSGYAITFGQPSKDLGGFTEVIDKNAFDGVDLSDVYMVSNHDFSKVLASTKAGTLKLNVDDKGLHFEFIKDENGNYIYDEETALKIINSNVIDTINS